MLAAPRASRRPCGLSFGRFEETLLAAIVAVGTAFPILREVFHAALGALCGAANPTAIGAVRTALDGKLVCAGALALALPCVARRCAGSWGALTRVSAGRGALVIGAVTTTTLTAYDWCTGFHAADRTAQGCACWLTAALAALAALVAALAILAGRALLRTLREAVCALVEALFASRAPSAAPFLRRGRRVTRESAGVLWAYRCAGRGPPRPAASASFAFPRSPAPI